MAGLVPMAFYGLTVPAGDIMTPALKDFPATFRITMAAIDPSAENAGVSHTTLKIIHDPLGAEDDDEDESDEDEESDVSFDEAQMKALLGDEEDEEENEDSEDDEELNGGPSDPAKTEKARKAATVKQLQKELQAGGDDGNMEVDGINGITSKKGKGKALDDDDIDEEDDDDIAELEEFVLCTLDPAKNYQQPLDVTVGKHEQVYFKVSGTHDVHITGNFVASADELGPRVEYDDEEEGDELSYDLTPDEDELEDEDEDDELDDMEDPRVTELDSEEETPKLVKAEKTAKKGKNKRAASLSDEDVEEKEVGLDDIIARTIKPDNAQVNGKQKLSKSQKKKLKNNAGDAVAAPKETKPAKEDDKSKNDKKVQFAKNLEQTPSIKAEPPKSSTNGEKAKASLGVKTLQGGVKIDDKKLGSGPAAKSGNRVSMRYIGKLEKDNKVFDANKKGKPFSFKLGSGEVIKGWDIGVAGMSSGGERRITIPASLGYGSKGTNGIPPNSNLIFDVKMLEAK